MAQNPINMNQIRRILQLIDSGLSNRSTAKQCAVSPKTIRNYKRRIAQSNVELKELLQMNDEQLSAIIYEPIGMGKQRQKRYDELKQVLEQCKEELKKTGVTYQLLWQEYRIVYPDGYSYTQFCNYLRLELAHKQTVMHFLHRMGEKVMVDFAGKTISYTDQEGEIVPCQVFVAVLPYSGYSYVEAVRSQHQQNFISAMENALEYFGGAPECIFSDNLRSYVKRSSRYEPEFTDLTEQFSIHYNTAVMAARVKKPRDKASVEKTVHLTYQRIYAPLRNQIFRSLQELNCAFKQQLTQHHDRLFRDKSKSRKQLFEEEQKHLRPLPQSRIEIKQRVEAKVQKNYHVLLGEDRHFYSVPYNHTGKRVQLVYTSTGVEVYHQHQRIAIHPRHQNRNGYTTLADHMPSHHKHYTIMKGWDGEYFKGQAKKISSQVLSVIEQILCSRQFCEQSYNACIGILRLADKYGNDRLTGACGIALQANSVNYRFINNILQNNMDLRSQQTLFSLPTEHQNLRGSGHYE